MIVDHSKQWSFI